MPVPVEKVAEGQCYRVEGQLQRKVLRLHNGQVTFILRGKLGWDVLRSQEDVDRFAATCDAVIDCGSLQDIA